MKDAKTLLLEFLAAVTHGQDAAALFAEEGALELPFCIRWASPGATGARQSASSKTLSPGSIWTSPSSPRTPTS